MTGRNLYVKFHCNWISSAEKVYSVRDKSRNWKLAPLREKCAINICKTPNRVEAVKQVI